MAAQNILTALQNKFIQCLSAHKSLNVKFYLTGGTALAAYYLKHRYSEDLDFFSEENVEPLAIKDLPRMLIKINQKIWADFFISYAKSLSKDIFT
ncbi:MAG: nucleotidyl transferase AbiEii/AbiGii toxin family protein [Candidatus Omnitrophica bacterium]|nr:nucleotidyl transferase AbiEii/AbiGii toxin family protein [Candidatus Omnitrophota bacterium]